MLVAFIFLCFFAKRITGYESNFCGYIKESEKEFRTEFCNAQDVGGDPDSSPQLGLKSNDIEPHMFKWMAFYDTKWPVTQQRGRCGGVLISNAAVLTAAHCLQRNGETALVTSVTLGVHDIQNPGDGMLEIPVERTVVHEHFNRMGILDYDVGILFLDEEIVWKKTPQIRPICLPPGGETYQYTKAIVTGWGFQDEFNATSIMKQGEVTVYDQLLCSTVFNSMDPEVMLCSGSLHQTSGCRGDGGGPVISRRPNQMQHELIGISLGNCVESPSRDGPIYASMFTKIAEHRILDWIHDKLTETPNPAKTALNKVTAEKSELEKTLRDKEKTLEHIKARNTELERILKSRDAAISMTSTTTLPNANITTTASTTDTTINTTTTATNEILGNVLLMGGIDSSNSKTARVEIYGHCPDNNEWRLREPTKGAAAAILRGAVYFCGGETSSGYSTNKCYIRVGSKWLTGFSMVKSRYRFSLNNVGDRLVAVGGDIADSAKTVEVLDPAPHTWKLQNYTLDRPRRYHCALTMSDTTLMLVGGFFSITTQLLDIDTGSVTQYRDLPQNTAREAPACGLFKERIILTGGYGRVITSEVFTLDPSDTGNPWVSAGRMVEARAYHTMAILKGVPTVFGGYGGSSDSRLDSIEEMQPDGTWRIAERLSRARSIHTSVTIPC